MGRMTHEPDPRRWKALALLCAVALMVILDSQIVIVALPSLRRDLGFSEDGAQWVLSAYLLAFGGLLMLGGRTGDLLGRRRTLIAGTALFAAASLACGLATSPGFLVGARVVHGVSAALMAPTALSILVTTFDDDAERNTALAVWGAVGGVGATVALLVGGVLTDAFGWRAIFFINIPIALVLLALAPVLLRESRAPERVAFDAAGRGDVDARARRAPVRRSSRRPTRAGARRGRCSCWPPRARSSPRSWRSSCGHVRRSSRSACSARPAWRAATS